MKEEEEDGGSHFKFADHNEILRVPFDLGRGQTGRTVCNANRKDEKRFSALFNAVIS
jgi:hypothetical protein